MITLDIETTPDPRRPSGQRLTVCSTVDIYSGHLRQFDESTIGDLLSRLPGYERVITYNGISFDLRVLSDYIGQDLTQLVNVFDLYRDLCDRTGRRDISLDELALGSLGKALQQHGIADSGENLYKSGQFRQLKTNSANGAREERLVYLFGQRNCFVLWRPKESGQILTIPVTWS
jgi:hypothetical protein